MKGLIDGDTEHVMKCIENLNTHCRLTGYFLEDKDYLGAAMQMQEAQQEVISALNSLWHLEGYTAALAEIKAVNDPNYRFTVKNN